MAIDFKKIAKQYHTPLYLYDLDSIIERIRQIKSSLDPEIKLYYAVKANPNLHLLKKIRPEIDGFDISSAGELKQCNQAGINSSILSFAGPGKSPQELQKAIESSCGSISIESEDELIRIIETAKSIDRRANVSIRINPQKIINKFAMKMGGKPTQFGVDEENVSSIIKLIKDSQDWLNFIGYHVYSGTQCLEAESLRENFEYILQMIGTIIKDHQLPGQKINLGGGFGVAYFQNNQPLDLEQTIKFLNDSVQKFRKDNPEMKFIIELGRYLTAEFGYYLTTVLATKNSRGKKYAIIDGGMHQNQSASGNLGQIIKKNYKIENIADSSEQSLEKIDISGCLCTPLDSMATDLEINTVNTDDLLVFYNSGAYGFSASPLMFLGHETPKEILYTQGKTQIIRDSKSILDFN